MSDIIKFYFNTGRGGCLQLLFKNQQQINNKLSEDNYKCIQTKCSSVIGVNKSFLTVTKEPTARNGHNELIKCRIEVQKVINMMKYQAKNDTSASKREIYDQRS